MAILPNVADQTAILLDHLVPALEPGLVACLVSGPH